jgi:hypothetical protein
MATALSLLLVVAIAAPEAALIQRNLAARNGELASKNASLAADLKTTIKDLNAANEELKKSYSTLTKQKDDLRRRLLNSDLIRIPNLMARPDVGLSRILLERHAPLPGEPDFRSFAWHYWWRECNQHDQSITLEGYQPLTMPGRSLVVAISPNGNLIATPDRFGLLLVDLSSPTRRGRAGMQSLAKAMAFASEEQLLTVSQMVESRSVWLDQVACLSVLPEIH